MPIDFGWSYPAGVSDQDIDNAVGANDTVLYAENRENAKALAVAPETQQYIELLEAVALAAVKHWNHLGDPGQNETEKDLRDALALLDFMEE